MAQTTCDFVFRSEKWNAGHSKTIEGNFVWRCPHPTIEGYRHCIFHTSPTARQRRGIGGNEIKNAFQEVLRSDRPNRIHGARFEDLDLDYFSTANTDTEPLILRGSTISGTLSLEYARISNPLFLDTCVIGEIDASFGSLSMIGLQKTVLKDSADFYFAKIDGILATDSGFGRFSMQESDIDKLIMSRSEIEAIDLMHARVGGGKFEEMDIKGDANFNATQFEKVTNFRDTEFFGDTEFAGSLFRQDAYFGRTVFHQSASFENAEFRGKMGIQDGKCSGEISFEEAHIADNLYGGGRILSDRLVMRNATVEGHVNFLKCDISGKVDLLGANVSNFFRIANMNTERLDLRHTNFENFHIYNSDITDLRAHSCEISEFQCSESSISTITFFKSEVGAAGFLDVELSEFTGSSSDFNSLSLHSYSLLKEEDSFGRRSRFDLSQSTIRKGRLSQPSIGRVLFDLTQATLGDVIISRSPQGPFYYLNLRGTEFAGFDFRQYSDDIHERSSLHKTLQVGVWGGNQQLNELETVYREARLGAEEVNARDVRELLYKREKRYSRAKQLQRAKERSGAERVKLEAKAFENWLLDKSTGYGEDPIRPVAASLGAIVVFSPVYILFGNPTGNIVAKVLFGIVTSTQSLATLVFGSNNHLQGILIRFFSAVEGLLGAFFIALLVFALTKDFE